MCHWSSADEPEITDDRRASFIEDQQRLEAAAQMVKSADEGTRQAGLTVMKELAAKTDAAAMNALGWYHQNILKDDSAAVPFFFEAAHEGYGMAQCNYGLCLLCGYGIDQNAEQAVSWFRRATEQLGALAGTDSDSGARDSASEELALSS